MSKTRTEKEIIAEASRLKMRMVKRAANLKKINDVLAVVAGYMAPDVKPERLETMENEFTTLKDRQQSDAYVYATLRWVLGLTDEINPNNLELGR